MRSPSVPRKFADARHRPYLIIGQYVVMMSNEMTFLHQSESDVKCHGKLKRYPNGDWELLVASRPVFSIENGWEVSNKSDSKRPQTGKKQAADLDRARRRAAAKLRDIARCTPFRWFVTLTFAPEKVNRYDPAEIIRKMRSWLDNRVRRNGLAYVLVPELHKDGAVHFHGFFNDSDIGFVDSGTLKVDRCKAPRRPRSEKQRQEWLAACAKPVYNIADWQFGFSTAMEIYGDYNAAIGYCCKYIGKQSEKIGGRWYYSGGALSLPEVDYIDCDFYAVKDDPRAYCFTVDAAGCAFVLLRGDENFGLVGADGGGLCRSGDGD